MGGGMQPPGHAWIVRNLVWIVMNPVDFDNGLQGSRRRAVHPAPRLDAAGGAGHVDDRRRHAELQSGSITPPFGL